MYTSSGSKIGIIALSIILLTGIIFVPAKQIKGQSVQASTSSINQRANQIAQTIANSNLGANKIAISQVVLAKYTQIVSTSGQAANL